MESITSREKASMNFTSSTGCHATVWTVSSMPVPVYWPERRRNCCHQLFTSGQSPLIPASKYDHTSGDTFSFSSLVNARACRSLAAKNAWRRGSSLRCGPRFGSAPGSGMADAKARACKASVVRKDLRFVAGEFRIDINGLHLKRHHHSRICMCGCEIVCRQRTCPSLGVHFTSGSTNGSFETDTRRR